jgi:hypothetical protein
MNERYVVRVRTPDGKVQELPARRGTRITLEANDRIEMTDATGAGAVEAFLEGNDLITERANGRFEVAIDLDNSLADFGAYFFPAPMLQLLGLTGIGVAQSAYRVTDTGRPMPQSMLPGTGFSGADGAVPVVGVELLPPPQQVNRWPQALDDAGATQRDVVLTLPASLLLANDSDTDGDALTIAAVGTAVNGTAALNPDADGDALTVVAATYQGAALTLGSAASTQYGTLTSLR